MNYSLLILKPDAVQRNIERNVVELLMREFEQLINRKITIATSKQVDTLYLESLHQPYYPLLLDYMTSGPLISYIVIGADAVNRLNQVVGATDPSKANSNCLRKIFGQSILKNSIHSSNENRLSDEIEAIYGKLPHQLLSIK